MDRWFSSPKIFYHLWGCKTKAVGTVMSNKKEVPKPTFFWRTEKRRKILRQRDHLLAMQLADFWGETIHTVFQQHTQLAGKSRHSFLVSAEKDASDCESCEDVLQYTAENAVQDFALGGVLN
jgi:hypothetical protein